MDTILQANRSGSRRAKGVGVRDGSGVVRDIQDGLGRIWKLESWKQWSGEEGGSSDGDSLGEGGEILQWTEVLREDQCGEGVAEGGGTYAAMEFEKWARGVKDRTDVCLREMGNVREEFGVVGWEPDIVDKRHDIVGVEGTIGGENSTVEDIEMGYVANKVTEECGTVEPLREEDKAYTVRQKRPAEISHGRNKRQKLDILGETLVKEVGHDMYGEDTVMENVGCTRWV